MSEPVHTRETTGQAVRARLRHNDVVGIIAAAQLPDHVRTLVLEHVDTAAILAERDDLGGARYLQHVADGLPDDAGSYSGMKPTLRRLATAHIHPRLLR